jgi:hypothetical protein
MPPQMPALASDFQRRVDQALQLAKAGEIVRAVSPPRTTLWSLWYTARLEALYEMAFLRIFIEWEVFLEEAFLRYLCGYASRIGPVNLLHPPFRTLADARNALLGGHDYLSWARPTTIQQRARAYVIGGTHELVIASAATRLEWFAAIRHRVAHASAFARSQLDLATVQLNGRRYRGASAGRFLRDWNTSRPVPERWIHTIASELKGFAKQIVP